MTPTYVPTEELTRVGAFATGRSGNYHFVDDVTETVAVALPGYHLTVDPDCGAHRSRINAEEYRRLEIEMRRGAIPYEGLGQHDAPFPAEPGY